MFFIKELDMKTSAQWIQTYMSKKQVQHIGHELFHFEFLWNKDEVDHNQSLSTFDLIHLLWTHHSKISQHYQDLSNESLKPKIKEIYAVLIWIYHLRNSLLMWLTYLFWILFVPQNSFIINIPKPELLLKWYLKMHFPICYYIKLSIY